MSKSEELRPCPFCGGEAEIMDMGYPHWVYCKACTAKVHGQVIGEGAEEASIEAWNKRTREQLMMYGYPVDQLAEFRTMLIENPELFDRLKGQTTAEAFIEGVNYALTNMKQEMQQTFDETTRAIRYSLTYRFDPPHPLSDTPKQNDTKNALTS